VCVGGGGGTVIMNGLYTSSLPCRGIKSITKSCGRSNRTSCPPETVCSRPPFSRLSVNAPR
jgi:hypothetical protein